MNVDPHANCLCGSGKKFRFCCQPIYPGIQRALEQEAAGKPDDAEKLLEELTREHAGNPEAWGQYARLLATHGKAEQAEEVLEKAFAINPNYPFGLLIRATIRHAEGELRGAVMLARRAADVYDPQAHEALSQVYSILFEGEMRHNRPVAARAALEQLVHLQPADPNVRGTLDTLFGSNSRLPEAARKRYELHKPPAGKREVWNRVMDGATARLSDLAVAFGKVVKEDPADGPAWFNLGLVLAWLGENDPALDALEKAVDLESGEPALEAATLAEVMRCGFGMDEKCDYHEYSAFMQIRNAEPINALLNDWARTGRLVPIQTPTEQENVFHALLLELTTTGLVTVGKPAADAGRLAGYLFIAGNVLRVTSPLREPFDRLREELRQKLALPLNALPERRGPAGFQDVLSEALIFPLGPQEPQKAAERILDHAGKYFEETWIHRPRRSLGNVAPVDAPGTPRLRKKLLGVIAFMQQCAGGGMLNEYDFDRLRRKLGLLNVALAAQAAQAATGATIDVTAMGTPELAALKSETLSDEQLEQAYRAAHRLDASELAAHFAAAVVARPVSTDRPDRYPFFSYLIQKARHRRRRRRGPRPGQRGREVRLRAQRRQTP